MKKLILFLLLLIPFGCSKEPRQICAECFDWKRGEKVDTFCSTDEREIRFYLETLDQFIFVKDSVMVKQFECHTWEE